MEKENSRFMERAKAMLSLKEGNSLFYGSTSKVGKTECDLLEASKRGDKNYVTSLLKNGVDVNAKDENGKTPLYLASFHGNLDVVKLLLRNRARIDERDKDGDTPLSISSIAGFADVVVQLIKRGANVNTKNVNGRTPLYWASWFGHFDVVKKLLQNGAALDEPDKDGQTPLSASSREGYSDAIIELIKVVNFTTKKKHNQPSSLVPSGLNSFDSVNKLLENGPDNLTISHFFSHTDAVLGQSMPGVDVGQFNNLIDYSILNYSKIIKILIENGADVNAKDKRGRTALHIAAQKNKKTALIILLENGANSEMTDEEGMTALDLAYGQDIVDILRRKSPKNRRDKGKSEYNSSIFEIEQLRREKQELLRYKNLVGDRDILSRLDKLSQSVKEIPPRLIRNKTTIQTRNINNGEKAGYQFFNFGQSQLAGELVSETGERVVHLTVRISELESELQTRDGEIEDLKIDIAKLQKNDEEMTVKPSVKSILGSVSTEFRERIALLTEAIGQLETEFRRTKDDKNRLQAENDAQSEELRYLGDRISQLSITKVEQRTLIGQLEKRVEELRVLMFENPESTELKKNNSIENRFHSL